MINTIPLWSIIWSVCAGSSLLPAEQLVPEFHTSSSSQYFERIYNRLIVAPPDIEPPLIPFAQGPQLTVGTPEVNDQKVIIEPNRNVAVAIASVQAAPVATFFLPPSPFAQPIFVPDTSIEDATENTKSETEPTTERIKPDNEVENVTPTKFVQGLPAKENEEFYKDKPINGVTLNTVPAPLTYMAPPINVYYAKPQYAPVKPKTNNKPIKYKLRRYKVYKVPSNKIIRHVELDRLRDYHFHHHTGHPTIIKIYKKTYF